MPAHDPTNTTWNLPSRALALAAFAALIAAGTVRASPASGPISLPPPRSFAAGIAAIEKATGAKAIELALDHKAVPAAEGRAFKIDGHVATRLIDGSHDSFLAAGLYLFRYERSFGMAGGKDIVALVPTTDRAALIRRVATSDPHKVVTPEQIAEWLAALERDEPFALNEIGVDYVAGRFKEVPKDPAAVARRCAEIAPELVKGSGSAIDLLTEEIRSNRTLYLIW
jgi:hypothetical protein